MSGPVRRRKRTTNTQRQLAAQWLTRTGREVTPASVEELAPHVRMQGRPELAEVAAFARLVRLGQVPTRGAVQGEMASLAASEARRRALKQTRAAALADIDGTGRAVAAYVAAYRERTGVGPSWGELRGHGLLLTIPDLLALDLPALVTAAGYPGTQVFPPVNYLLSLLALKLTATRRVSHVEDLAADPGAALFAGLTALPKTTALTSYSYRLSHAKQAAFLTALDKATLNTGLATGEAVNLNFHAVMHWGHDPALEKHYVPSRSQRTRSVLTFFAEDADSHTLRYANADLFTATQNTGVLTFADHWHTVTGHDPKLLIMDSKVTTQPELGKLNARGITFITLRACTPKLSAALHDLPATAWTAMTMARAGGKIRRVHVIDDPTATLSSYPGTLRQIAVAGLGHDEPTILITNDLTSPAKKIVERYARRMNFEQRLAESIRSFGLDALAGAVPLNVDLDVVLTVLAHTVCAAMRRRLPGYATTTPTSCNAGSCKPAARSSTAARRSSSDSTAAPTHRYYAKPNSPPSPSPGGATDDSATSSPETRVELAA